MNSGRLLTLAALLASCLAQRKQWNPNSIHAALVGAPTAADVDKTGDFGGIKPMLYKLELQGPLAHVPTYSQTGFRGELRLTFYTTRPTKMVYLHAASALKLNKSTIRVLDGSGKLPIEEVKLIPDIDILQIELKQRLNKSQVYQVFTGQFETKMDGPYAMGIWQSKVHQSPTKLQYAAVTQFQMANARKAFPCIDMPQFKANFSLTMVHPPDTWALSNMEVKSFNQNSDGWHKTEFVTTPPLPTYTYAFAVLPKAYRAIGGRSQSGVPLQIWFNSYRVTEALAQKLFNYTKYSYDTLEKTFNYHLPMQKLDLIMVSQFAVQGMENYGMITLNQEYLKTHWPSFQMSLIAHEVAHQWISNLLTVDNWRDICLQEGITDHFARETVKNYFGEHSNMWQQYYLEKYIYSIRKEENNLPPKSLILSDTPSLADVSGSCFGRAVFLVDGLQKLVGSDFENRMRSLVSKHRYGHFSLSDFSYQFSRNFLDRNTRASQVFDYWFKHGGYPSMFVSRDYRNKRVQLEQRSLYPSGNSYTVTNDIWPMGLEFELQSSQWASPKQVMDTPTLKINSLPIEGSDWLLANPDMGYFYRVNYDLHNWQLLANALRFNPGQFTAVTRAQLVSDFCFFYRLRIIPSNGDAVRKDIMAAVHANTDYFQRYHLYMGSCGR